jgi:16S rRNA G966 N2-methylase RsmD
LFQQWKEKPTQENNEWLRDNWDGLKIEIKSFCARLRACKTDDQCPRCKGEGCHWRRNVGRVPHSVYQRLTWSDRMGRAEMNFSLIAQRVKEGASIAANAPGIIAFVAEQTDDKVLKEFKAQAKAVMEYLAVHRKDVSVVEHNAAAKIYAKADCRLGEVLAATVRPRGRNSSDNGMLPEEITPMQSSRAQWRAKVEWERVEAEIDAATARNEKVSLSRLFGDLIEEVKIEARKAKARAGKKVKSDLIVDGDFNHVLPTLPDESVDLIFTDPPYDKESLPLYSQLAEHAERILTPGGSLFAYVGHYAVIQVATEMSAHLNYLWLCGVKHSGNAARLPGFALFVHWKPLLWFVKGARRDKEMVADFVTSEFEGKDDHDWQQASKEAAYYIERLTIEGEMVLDPLCGSGTTCLAALQLGRRCLGIEIDPDRAAVAKTRIHQLISSAVD